MFLLPQYVQNCFKTFIICCNYLFCIVINKTSVFKKTFFHFTKSSVHPKKIYVHLEDHCSIALITIYLSSKLYKAKQQKNYRCLTKQEHNVYLCTTKKLKTNEVNIYFKLVIKYFRTLYDKFLRIYNKYLLNKNARFYLCAVRNLVQLKCFPRTRKTFCFCFYIKRSNFT